MSGGRERRDRQEGDQQRAGACQVARDRVGDRRGERQQRELDRHERAEEREEPERSADAPKRAAARRCNGLGVLHERLARLRARDVHERTLDPDHEHQHGYQQAERRPAADRVPAAVRPDAQRDREGGLGHVMGHPVEVDAGRRVRVAPARDFAVGAVEQHLELDQEERPRGRDHAGKRQERGRRKARP